MTSHRLGSIQGFQKTQEIEYASLYCDGLSLDRAAPESLQETLKKAQRRLKAYAQSFRIAKIDMREHCIFDLVPQDFLKEFCEIKNQITEHVLTKYDKPPSYDHLNRVSKLLYKIKYQNLNLNATIARTCSTIPLLVLRQKNYLTDRTISITIYLEPSPEG